VDGTYSVKSAYNLCMNMAADHIPNDNEINRDWNLIWKQSIPPKVRAFLWRDAHCCLPTRHSLAQKGIPCEDDCVHCDVMAETHTHLFFVCPKVMDCWARVQLDTTVRDLLLTTNDFATILFDFLDRLNPHHKSLASMILWSIWKNRNNKLWEATDVPPYLIVQRAKDNLDEWSCIQRARQPQMSTPLVFPWTKPPISFLKCNVDCALFNNNTITGFGFCFRDSSGQFVTGMSNYSHSATSPPEAEALGLFEAIQFAIDRDMTSVIFETDCKLVVDLVYSPIVPQNEIGDIITSCKHLMSVHNSYVVRHTRRQANRVAHSIARASLSHPSPYIFDYVPDYLYSIIINEMA